jgi:predicted phage tail protein
VFELYVYSLDGKVVAQYETDQFRYEFYGLDAGAYSLGVRGRNENGMKGAETQISLVIGVPSAPSFIQWTPGLFSADIVPVMSVSATTDTSFEFWFTGEVPASSVSNVENEAQFLGRATQWTLHALKADTTYYMYVRTKNAFGVSSFVESSGKASSDIPGMIDYIDEAIRDSEAFINLTENIDTNIEGMLQNALDNDSSVTHQYQQFGEVRADVITISTTVATVSQAMAELETQVQAQMGDLTSAVNEKLTAVVRDDGTASASYTLRVGIQRGDQYYSAGMAIGIEPSGSSYKSTLAFNADQFGIYTGSSAGGYQLAFAALNGQVFLRSAFIQNGSIDNAKIGNFIQSYNFVPGVSGWQWNKDGTMQNYGSDGAGAMKQTNITQSVKDENGVLRAQFGKITGVF